MTTPASEPPTTPRKIVTYPIGSIPNAGAVYIYGPSDAKQIALLCGGFPDDHECFLPMATRLAKEANCLVGVTCLPGYDDREDMPYTAHPNAGYSFDELVAATREAVKTLRAEHNNGDKTPRGSKAKLTGIFHDWGVVPGSMYTNRCLEDASSADAAGLSPDQLVLFDVLGPPHPDTKDLPVVPKDTWRHIITTLTYRIVFAKAFFLRCFISKILAQVYALVALPMLRLLGLSPTGELDAKVMQSRHKPLTLDRLLYMAYPYFNMFAAVFTGTAEEAFHGFSLPKDLTKTPVLYMYGTEKKVMFHDMKALKILEQEEKDKKSKCKAVKVKGAGHWLYLHKPDLCFEEVKKFVTDA